MSNKAKVQSQSGLEWKIVRSACLTVLESLLDQRVGFQPDPRANKRLRYVAQGPNVKYAVARESYPIFPFASTNGEVYWLALAIECERIGLGEKVTAISILFFSGADEQRPIFRAEWDCTDSAHLQALHAQPHWHVYTSLNHVNEEYDTFPLHFALSARWQTEGLKSHQQRLSNEGEVKDWINGCLVYVKTELASQ